MSSEYSLLVPASLKPSFYVEGRRALISLFFSRNGGSIISYVCSVGGLVATAKVRAEISAWVPRRLGCQSCRPSSLFSHGNVAMASSLLEPTRVDEWHSTSRVEDRFIAKYLDVNCKLMFLYFLYDRPMDCYPAYNFDDLSPELFRRSVASAVVRYSSWLENYNYRHANT